MGAYDRSSKGSQMCTVFQVSGELFDTVAALFMAIDSFQFELSSVPGDKHVQAVGMKSQECVGCHFYPFPILVEFERNISFPNQFFQQ